MGTRSCSRRGGCWRWCHGAERASAEVISCRARTARLRPGYSCDPGCPLTICCRSRYRRKPRHDESFTRSGLFSRKSKRAAPSSRKPARCRTQPLLQQVQGGIVASAGLPLDNLAYRRQVEGQQHDLRRKMQAGLFSKPCVNGHKPRWAAHQPPARSDPRDGLAVGTYHTRLRDFAHRRAQRNLVARS